MGLINQTGKMWGSETGKRQGWSLSQTGKRWGLIQQVSGGVAVGRLSPEILMQSDVILRTVWIHEDLVHCHVSFIWLLKDPMK